MGTRDTRLSRRHQGVDEPFVKPMNEIPKVVFSDSLASAHWGETTLATGDLAEGHHAAQA